MDLNFTASVNDISGLQLLKHGFANHIFRGGGLDLGLDWLHYETLRILDPKLTCLAGESQWVIAILRGNDVCRAIGLCNTNICLIATMYHVFATF